MQRRDFLKVLGIGVTIPLAPALVAGETNPAKVKTYRDEFIRAFNEASITLKGFYDKFEDEYSLRTTILSGGEERHNLCQVYAEDMNYSHIAEFVSNVLKEHGYPHRISETMVERAFNHVHGSGDRI